MVRAENNLRILFFYNYKDKNLCEKLMEYVSTIGQSLKVPFTLLYDQHIQAGQEWEKELEMYFDNADIILLLISSSFLSSPYCKKETRIALQKQEEKNTRIIPIILHPVVWDNSLIGHLLPLPASGKPISDRSWKQNAALHDVSLGLQDVIQQLSKERGLEVIDEDSSEEDTVTISSTAFNWTDSIVPFNYLTLSGKDQDTGVSRLSRLRIIMRIFYELQKVSSHKPLDEQAIYEIVQKKSNSEYSLQDCQKDLKYLVSRSNLVRMDDMSSMAHSIPAFDALLHKKSYQATSDGVEIERLIEDRMQSNRGRLSKSDLSDLKKHLLEINEYIERSELKPGELDDIADKWVSTFERWENIIKSSRDFFSALERNSHYGQYDFDKYMEYKNTVTRYVQSFADALLNISHEISDLFSSWSQKKDLLIYNIAQGEYKKHPDLEKGPSLEETIERIGYQITSVETWFKEGAHVFYERASSEIHRVVNRAVSLALYQRSHVNNLIELSKLAARFMDITNFESALQIFDAAFAHALPLHLSENLAGHAQMYERQEDMSSVWDEPPPARLSLISSRQRNAGTGVRKLEDPMYEDLQEMYTLQAREIQKEADRQQRFTRLFAQSSLDLGSFVSIIDPLDRDILEDIIDACLNHPTYRYPDQTGSIILLLNPYEQKYTHLCSHDGVLFLPCYQLKLQNSPEDSDELLLIGDQHA